MSDWDPRPPVLRDPTNLGFVAQMLAWRPGDPPLDPPPTLGMPLPEFVALLDDPKVRHAVVVHLSKAFKLDKERQP